MNKNYLKDLSDEEREQLRVKAEQNREEKKQYALKHLKYQWVDKPHWKELASKHGTKLPNWYVPGSEVKFIKRLFRNSPLDIQDYIYDMGCKTLLEMVECNKDANAQAMVGWALEYIEEKLCNGQY